MIETKTIKNWLEKDLHFFLKKFFLFEYPHFYGHSSLSSIEGKMFYNSDLNKNDPLSKFLLFKISKTFNENFNKKISLDFKDMYINVQHPNMEGEFHTDPSDLTFLYMLIGNGNFEIKNETSISFEENKFIMFNGKKLHRGLSPDKGVRITLACKANPIDEN